MGNFKDIFYSTSRLQDDIRISFLARERFFFCDPFQFTIVSETTNSIHISWNFLNGVSLHCMTYNSTEQQSTKNEDIRVHPFFDKDSSPQ
jgi:hypothetical protein